MIRPGDLILDALQALTLHKLRTGLTTLGILFGVAAVISMQSIGEGARREAEAILARAGLTRIIVRAEDIAQKGDAGDEIRRKTKGLQLSDALAVKAAIPAIIAIGGRKMVEVEDVVPHPSDGGNAPRVVGSDRRYLSSGTLTLKEGRLFDAWDEETSAPVCVLGKGAARRLFGAGSVVGRQVRIDEHWCRVIGVVAEESSADADVPGLDLADRNAEIYLPLSSALKRFDDAEEEDPEVDEITLEVGSADEVTGVAEVAGRILARLHGGAQDYQVVVPLKLLEQSEETQRLFNAVMALIAGISLLVGGIGIMNIMLSTVMERTREIGVRRSLGATMEDVSRLFLLEAAAISLLGGLLGVAGGGLASYAIGAFTGWHTVVTLRAVALSFLISVGVGLASGWWPARTAAKMDPIEALRRD